MKRYAVAVALILVVALSALTLNAQDPCSEPVSTLQGPVVGEANPKLPICEYKGVPYAAPPVGNLRWKPPEPPAKRATTLMADRFSAECIQPGAAMPGVKGSPRSEDCLYLNIWRPNKTGAYPVMLWIHGGALETGSGVIPIYWGDRLAAQKDVVVVTINYRLHVFGFLALPELSTEDAGSSGNYGLLDQVAALKWVKDNIAGFGGDPTNVTIFGESAGGWSVCNLLATPLAAGLFSKAVIESGGCEAATTLEKGYAVGANVVKYAGCENKDALKCLRSQPPDQIMDAIDAWGKAEKEARKASDGKDDRLFDLGAGGFKWLPHVDGWVLKEKPIDALRSGRFNQVPLMVGSNRDEAKLFTLPKLFVRTHPESKVHEILVSMLGENVAQGVEKLYPYKQYRKPADAAIDALGDAMLGCKCFDAAEAVSLYQPVYYYRFDYDRNLLPHMAGAPHAFEIPFVFGTLDRPPASLAFVKAQENAAQPLSKQMMSYWTNFAKNGAPNKNGLPNWPKYDTKTRERIIFDSPITTEPANNVDKCGFWNEHDFFKQ